MKSPNAQGMEGSAAARNQAVQAFFDEQAALFSDGNIDKLATYCAYPLPFYTDDGIVLAKTAEMYQDILASYLSRIVASGGPVTFAAHILGVGRKVNGRFPVRLDWAHIGPDKTERGRSKLRYFLADRPQGGWLIEIIEYFQFAGPPILEAPTPKEPPH